MKSWAPVEDDQSKRYAKWLLGSLVLALVGACYPVISSTVGDATVWRSDASDDADAISKRVKARGTLTSVSLALTMGVTTSWMDATCDVDLIRSQLFISIILGATVGFLLDSSMASEEGLRRYRGTGDEPPNDFRRSVRYALSQLTTVNFARYLVTVLVDLFISGVLISKLTTSVSNAVQVHSSTASTYQDAFAQRRRLNTLKKVIASFPMNKMIPAVCTGIVSLLTFAVYTNNTRLSWAIRDGSVQPNDGITTNLLMCGATAAALFLVSKVKGLTGAIKIALVLFYLSLVTAMSQAGVLEALPSLSGDQSGKGVVGFLAILAVCTVIVFVSKGERDPSLSTRTKSLLACVFMLCFLLPLGLAVAVKGVGGAVGATFAMMALFGVVSYVASRSKRTLKDGDDTQELRS